MVSTLKYYGDMPSHHRRPLLIGFAAGLASLGLSVGFMSATAALEAIPVTATKKSVANWVEQASSHAMSTSVTDKTTESECDVNANGDSYCVRQIGGGSTLLELQVGGQRYSNVRSNPPAPLTEQSGDVINENVVGNVGSVFNGNKPVWSYDPFRPWEAGRKAISWKLRTQANGDVVIVSQDRRAKPSMARKTRVAISADGQHVSIAAFSPSGDVLNKTVARLTTDFPISTDMVANPPFDLPSNTQAS